VIAVSSEQCKKRLEIGVRGVLIFFHFFSFFFTLFLNAVVSEGAYLSESLATDISTNFYRLLPGLNEASNLAFIFSFSLTFTSRCFLVIGAGY